jgi:hypothetical protein
LGVTPLRLRRQLHPKVVAFVVLGGVDEGQYLQRFAGHPLDRRQRCLLRERKHPRPLGPDHQEAVGEAVG